MLPWFIPVSPQGQGLTFPLHAHHQALLVAAVLTSVPLALVNETVFIIATGVHEVFPYGSLEEPFATFATVHAVVLPCSQEEKVNRAETVLMFIWTFP